MLMHPRQGSFSKHIFMKSFVFHQSHDDNCRGIVNGIPKSNDDSLPNLNKRKKALVE